MKVAVVTGGNAAEMSNGDPILLAAIERAGHQALHWRWDNESVDWSSIDAALIRSTWDYFGRPKEFRAWLVAVQTQTTLVNPPALLEWNRDKRYLVPDAGNSIRVPEII
ncbi:MAG: hypothetical protein GY811_29285 [Myxococcales bacterium]|nr:hypothetical protein [Myxococcales bacterium]